MRKWIALGISAITPVLFVACGDSAPPDQLCDPGTFIFCRCPDSEEGSRECKPDGQSFEECKLQSGDVCPDRPVGCGDGSVGEDEDCDDGNMDDDDACTSLCLNAVCGDGFVQMGLEDCDDGNSDDMDGCKNDCTAGIGCGNGMMDAGEECDDGNTDDTDACAECLNAKCGDGHLETNVEQCDDGNLDDGDACQHDCTNPVMETYGCPGTPVMVSMGTDLALTGDASPATNVFGGSCGGGSAPEVAYAVTPTESGNLFVTMDGNGNVAVDPVLWAAKDDCMTGAEVACSDNTFYGGAESIIFAVTGGSTYWIFADGYDGTSGPYSLNLHLQTGVPGDQCPGLPVTVGGTANVYLSGNTALANGGGGTSYKGSGVCASSASTQDVVYSVTPTATGTLTVTAYPDPNYDLQIYARSGSCTTGTQVGCTDGVGAGETEQMQVPVTAGQKVSLFVDGKNGSAGQYDLTLHLE